MTITETGPYIDLDGGAATTDNVSYSLSDGRIVHVWQNRAYTVDVQFVTSFAVYDIDGTQLIAPQRVSLDAGLPEAGTIGFVESVYAVTLNDDGAIQFHYNRWFPGVYDAAAGDYRIAPFNDNYSRRFDDAGTALDDGTDLGFGVQWTQRNSTSLQLENGQVAVFYHGELILLNADGSHAGATPPQNEAPAPTSAGIAIVETPSGLFTIYHTDMVVAQFHTLAGVASGAPITLESDPGATTRYAHLASQGVSAEVLRDGRIAVAWVGSSAALGDEDETGIFATILNADGSVDVPTFLVNVDQTSGGQYAPRIHGLDDGSFVVSYQTLGFLPSYQNTGLLQQVAGDGTLIGGPIELLDRYQSGFDSIIQSDGSGLLIGSEGNAQAITIDVVAGPITGTSGANTLTGTDGADNIDALAGNDRVEGLAGNDTLRGGDGADTLIGGEGNDSIFGGDTEADLRDIVYGGAGNDNIDGGYGNDELRGDAGNDNIAGGFGADTVIGGAGNDTLTGSAYGDEIFGSDGLDFINGGFGHDRVNGGAGADQFYHLGIADHGSDWIQDYNAADGDVLMWGGAAATADDFQINTADTANAGVDGVSESFVIYRPTGQIMWALVDGDAQSQINIQIAGQTFDLMV
jgi:RTX calcium-binding nonapeptide repeat (4 copies)